MKNSFWFLVIVLLLSACRHKEECHCNVRPEVEKYNDSLMSSEREENHQRFLRMIDEQPLPQNGELSIRFMRSNSFTNYFIIYKIHSSDQGYQLETKVCRPDTMHYPRFETVWKHSKDLTENQVHPIVQLINDSCFWTMVSQEEFGVLDGSAHVLEVYNPEGNPCTDKTYRMVVRFSASPAGFRSMCEKIMALETDCDQYK